MADRREIEEVKTIHSWENSLFVVEQNIPVIDLTSDKSSSQQPTRADIDICSCPLCDEQQCLKLAREVFPNGMITTENEWSSDNVPEIVCRRNKHITPMSSDDRLLRDFLKNAIEKK